MLDNHRTKIVATIGPATQDELSLQRMLQAGMNVARLNFSHGSHEIHQETYLRLRKLSHKLGLPVGIMQDLQGVKIRTGDHAFELAANQTIILTTAAPDTADKVFIDFPGLPRFLSVGKSILLDDGNIELQVVEIDGQDIHCRVITGGLLNPHKGVNLPGTHLDIPGFTDKDEEDLLFGLSLGVDAVAVSFVTSADDIARVRRAITQAKSRTSTPLVIAKLERPEALENLDSIIEIADGVMVARGDLGVEMPPEMVPTVQKKIILKANEAKKIVITATQMLDSMIHNPRPTRAEATDVANAIFDGTDAVMLSGETAIGEYPIETINMMRLIICEAELHLKEWGRWSGSADVSYSDNAEAIAAAARELAHDLNVATVVVFTQSGRTARIMSKARPRVPIIGFTPDEQTVSRMSFYWGVYPYKIPMADSIEEMLVHVDSAMIASTPIRSGQEVVVVCGFPVGSHRPPNLALLHKIGSIS
jgi:pyruvate kinase